MTIRWITDRLGTSPWCEGLNSVGCTVVDVRMLRDQSGNSPNTVRAKISEVLDSLKGEKPVVVCCDYGISRSNAIAAAALAEELGIDLGEGLRLVIEATGETEIKIDFVEDIRQVMKLKQRAPNNKPLILGVRSLIGRTFKHSESSEILFADPVDDDAVIENPILLDITLDALTPNNIIFCWRPSGLNTNRAIGQLITALRNVLEICRTRQIGLIFLSGYQVFSGHQGIGLVSCSKDQHLHPTGAVGDGLFMAEGLIWLYKERYGIKVTIVRTTHVYGPEDNSPGILNTFIRKAIAGEKIVTHRFENGVPYIDLLHVKDINRLLIDVASSGFEGVVHAASDNPITTYELAQLIVNKAGSKSLITSIQMPNNYSTVHLDTSFTRITLDWKPVITLDHGLDNLIAYHASIKEQHD